MKFSINEYKSALIKMPFFSGLIGLFLFTIAILSIFGIYEFIGINNFWNVVLVILIIIVSCIFLISSSCKLFRGLNLIIEENHTNRIKGIIKKIDKVIFTPRYYVDGEICRVVLITIDERKYYIMSQKSLYVGKKLKYSFMKNQK